MKRLCCVIAIALCAVIAATAAEARKRHRHQVQDANGNQGLVTVQTAAGIDITVSPAMAPKMQAFIADLVASGYTPKSIRCYARGGHVRGSRHYSGNACDIDQRGYGKTASRMYHVAALASAHGLRDGGSFRDWGHIDDGKPLHRDYTPPGATMLASAGHTVQASARRKHRRGAVQASVPPDRLTQYY